MSRVRTPINLRKGIKISAKTKRLYKQRDMSLDNDPDSRPLPPERWALAMRRDEYFRPIKKPMAMRVDADVLAWFRSKGKGYQAHINAILRHAMEAEVKSHT